jgi:hypothetical protein
MNEIVERGKAHLKSLPERRIEVPEWGEEGSPLVITWKPMTMAMSRKIYKPDRTGRPADGATINVRAVAKCACDKDGNPLFPDADAEFQLMNNVSRDVVLRIAAAILYEIEGEPGESAEDRMEQEKNA